MEKNNMEHNTKQWFQTGRGNVSANVAKSDADILSQEGEMAATEVESPDNPAGRKPVYATGDTPFHEGRGSGRGYGPGNK